MEPALTSLISLFFCGDVMLGRGIDQVLEPSVDPILHESYVKDARLYVELAEREHGAIPETVNCAYVWGDALERLDAMDPDFRIINLETSATLSDDYWRGKGIHYRMHPQNLACLKTAKIDCAVLANNHVLDWGFTGLHDTLSGLEDRGIRTVGAGRNRSAAEASVRLKQKGKPAVRVFAFGAPDAGVYPSWAAKQDRAGVNFIEDFSKDSLRRVLEIIEADAEAKDLVILSLHWGSNWGYDIPEAHQAFARHLIDSGKVDLIYGHSSHHVRPLEVYKNKLILYGCGDFINDYEGISGHEAYPDDLMMMYFPFLDPESGDLARLEMIPLRMRNFSLHEASEADSLRLMNDLNRESKAFGTEVRLESGKLLLERSFGSAEGANVPK